MCVGVCVWLQVTKLKSKLVKTEQIKTLQRQRDLRVIDTLGQQISKKDTQIARKNKKATQMYTKNLF